MGERPYTVERLAERWECSGQSIRNMIADGKLACFMVANKLVRIPASEVERIERCGSASSSTEEPCASSGQTSEGGRGADRFGPVIPDLPSNVMPISSAGR